MISSTTATLECAAQVSAAAIRTQSTGSPVIVGEQRAHRRRVLGGRQRVEQDMQREQHQAKTDRHPAEVADARAARPILNTPTPMMKSTGADRRDVER